MKLEGGALEMEGKEKGGGVKTKRRGFFSPPPPLRGKKKPTLGKKTRNQTLNVTLLLHVLSLGGKKKEKSSRGKIP